MCFFFGESACGCWGSLGLGRCLELSGQGVGMNWAFSVSCTASFAGIRGWFLGRVLHDWRASRAGRRGVCVDVMAQAVHRL